MEDILTSQGFSDAVLLILSGAWLAALAAAIRRFGRIGWLGLLTAPFILVIWLLVLVGLTAGVCAVGPHCPAPPFNEGPRQRLSSP